MDQTGDREGLSPRMDGEEPGDCLLASGGSNGQNDPQSIDLLRIKDQMASQCIEMKAKLHAGKTRRQSLSTSEAERELPGYISELEDAKTSHFNKLLALHRMQMWNAIAEKLEQNDPQCGNLKELSDRCMAFYSNIQTLQQEARELEDKIMDVQKKRLELKRLTHDKMNEIEELKKREHPEMEKYRATLEKGRTNVEKHKKMVIVTQHVLRGILLASKTNWMDDLKLRDVALSLEELPISD